jgi:hypothetical protein
MSKQISLVSESDAKRLGLEEMLVALCAFGEPSVRRMGGGWCSSIDMHVSGEGATFKVRSEFDHASASEAVMVCLNRVRETLSKYGVH